MKRIIIALIALMTVGAGEMAAQRLINVTGRVMQVVEKLVDGKKEKATEPFAYTHVYGLPTKAAAQQVVNDFGPVYFNNRKDIYDFVIAPHGRTEREAMTAMDGTYTVRDVPENGYLVFLPYEGNAKMLAIEGLFEMKDVVYEGESDGIVLSQVDVVGEDAGVTIDALTFGDLVKVSSSVPIEDRLMKKNVRVLVQPYYVDCNPATLKAGMPDTVFLSPVVFYGDENELTAERRMGFNLMLDSLARAMENMDSLRAAIAKNGKMPIQKEFRIPDPNRYYKAYAEIFYQDYTGVLYSDQFVIKHCENKDPMKFLDYNFGTQMLDPALPEFKVEPQIGQHDATGNINLTFLNGKAELDKTNPINDLEMARLDEELRAFETSNNNFLNAITVVGKASPEGGYDMNLNLARRRMDFILSHISSQLTAGTRRRLADNAKKGKGGIKQEAMVAGWDEVADSLEADSMFADAEAIRAIVAEHEGKPDAQYAKIRQLPNYNIIKEQCLPKLRSVTYLYTYQTMRSLSDKEILAKWQEHCDSVDKAVMFDRYEYWRLANTVKDTLQLPKLYKEYYEYTKRTQRKPDDLAACNHAAYCVKEGIADTTMLAPFIRKNRRLNWSLQITEDMKEYYNREPVVANQLAMYVLSKDYLNARIMGRLLPENEANNLLKAFLMCLIGFYKEPAYFEPVAATSTNNKVVVYIANGNYPVAQVICEEELEEGPRKYYFLAQIYKGKGGEQSDIIDNLVKCWKLDESFVEVADADALFVDNKGNKVEFDRALKKFDEWKEKQAKKKE